MYPTCPCSGGFGGGNGSPGLTTASGGGGAGMGGGIFNFSGDLTIIGSHDRR